MLIGTHRNVGAFYIHRHRSLKKSKDTEVLKSQESRGRDYGRGNQNKHRTNCS